MGIGSYWLKVVEGIGFDWLRVTEGICSDWLRKYGWKNAVGKLDNDGGGGLGKRGKRKVQRYNIHRSGVKVRLA